MKRMGSLEVGDRLPDVQLLDAEGSSIQLSSLVEGGPVVLVFLRYFGCTFCRAHVARVRDEREAFVEAGARVVLIGQGRPDQAAAFCRDRQLPFACTVDPDRRAFAAFGLGRARRRDLVDPRVATRAVRLAADPQTRQGAISGDPRQLGGTIVADRSGVIRFVHRNQTVWDDAPNDVVLSAVQEAARADVEGRPWRQAS